jgi:hypothetical protein
MVSPPGQQYSRRGRNFIIWKIEMQLKRDFEDDPTKSKDERRKRILRESKGKEELDQEVYD